MPCRHSLQRQIDAELDSTVHNRKQKRHCRKPYRRNYHNHGASARNDNYARGGIEEGKKLASEEAEGKTSRKDWKMLTRA